MLEVEGIVVQVDIEAVEVGRKGYRGRLGSQVERQDVGERVDIGLGIERDLEGKVA